MQKLKVGDTVQVMSGAERSASVNRGKIISIDREAERVRVEGLRVVKRHTKKGRDRANPDGGILEKPGSIALSNVALVCPKCDKATRTGVRAVDGKKKRFCKSCDATIE
ncbi:MAG: 50S ribosomal protein L24 [Myxococcaceae bacterium]|jgi:large subunit ribosomal protein L24